MFKELHNKLIATPNAAVLADVIHEAANAVKDTVPFKGSIYGGNDIKFHGGISVYGYSWLKISGNVIRSLCEQWFTDKPADSSFLEAVRKILDNKEQSATVKNVEIDQTEWVIKLTISYA